MHGSSPDVPPHLRRFVVEQDYAQYNAVDQAVWRFVLLQTYARLVHTAHPAYREGLSASGISVERIPSIAEMNDKLARFGWGAVCVDGFIPPRAFQEFQARRILPIAADIRTREHLVYTPAPDIIHEAAGHAPILTDPVYAAYLCGVGELGQRAFTLPEEERVYQAIYTLSEVKENPGLGEREVATAEAELRDALAAAREPSDATRASRLYWWTAEYGLVGRIDDYRLYGAGLLSSLWESHFCHDLSVKKLPLDESCTLVSYDITRPQPQLFVAESFEALHAVLARVRSTMAEAIGGAVSLERAERSRELGSFVFDSGFSFIGVLARRGDASSRPAFLELEGPCAVASGQRIVDGQGPDVHPASLIVVAGPLADGRALERLDARALASLEDAGRKALRIDFARGVRVSGRLLREQRREDGRLFSLELAEATLALPGEPPRALDRFTLFAAGEFVTAHAGSADSRFYPDTAFKDLRVPRARQFSTQDRALLALFERAESAHRAGAGQARADFPGVHAELAARHPAEWLLRWNLLESLLKAGVKGELAETLERELEALERHFEQRQPIASGLAYLRTLKAS
jgi:phenylalanine-4-hydroxylase